MSLHRSPEHTGTGPKLPGECDVFKTGKTDYVPCCIGLEGEGPANRLYNNIAECQGQDTGGRDSQRGAKTETDSHIGQVGSQPSQRLPCKLSITLPESTG